MNRLRSAWQQLPWDGLGRDPEGPLGPLRRRHAQQFWQAQPVWRRLLRPLSGLLWQWQARRSCRHFARRMGLPAMVARQLQADCLRSGARPVDAWLWRQVLRAEAHPLPARSAALLLGQQGECAAHALLRDKARLAERLQALALPVVPTLAQGSPAQLAAAPVWQPGAALFLKPRSGAASRDCFSLDIDAQGQIGCAGLPPLSPAEFCRQLPVQDYLLQPRLHSHPDLLHLQTGSSAPVLRLTVARQPGGPAFLLSAMLAVRIPATRPQSMLAHVWIGVQPADGRLVRGHDLRQPQRLIECLPWQTRPFAGQLLPGWAQTVDATLAASEALPGLPLINWDVIITADGAQILEGNSQGNWFLTCLPEAQGLAAACAADILLAWAAAEP